VTTREGGGEVRGVIQKRRQQELGQAKVGKESRAD